MELCYTLLGCFSHAQLFATAWTIAHQAPPSMGFYRHEYWSGLPCPPPGDLPDPGIKPASPVSPALAGGFFTTELPGKHFCYILTYFIYKIHATLCPPFLYKTREIIIITIISLLSYVWSNSFGSLVIRELGLPIFLHQGTWNLVAFQFISCRVKLNSEWGRKRWNL